MLKTFCWVACEAAVPSRLFELWMLEGIGRSWRSAACPPSRSGTLSSHPGHAENKQARLFNKDCYFSFSFVAIATYTYSKCKRQAFVSVSAVLKIRLCSSAKRDFSVHICVNAMYLIFLIYDIQQPVCLGICCLPVIACMKEISLLAVTVFSIWLSEGNNILNKRILSIKVSVLVSWEESYTLKGLQASTAKSNIKKGRS